MWIHAFGTDYYLDEAAFKRAMSIPPPPYRMDEVIAIQHQMRTVEDRLFAHMKQTAIPDPVETLKQHLIQMQEG